MMAVVQLVLCKDVNNVNTVYVLRSDLYSGFFVVFILLCHNTRIAYFHELFPRPSFSFFAPRVLDLSQSIFGLANGPETHCVSGVAFSVRSFGNSFSYAT